VISFALSGGFRYVLESKYAYVGQKSPVLSHSPELLMEGKFLEGNGKINHADRCIKRWLPESILNSPNLKFIRTENFKSDFKKVFGDYLDISRIPEWEYKQKVNTSTSLLQDEIKKELYSRKKRLYEKCPLWSQAENLAYGNIGCAQGIFKRLKKVIVNMR